MASLDHFERGHLHAGTHAIASPVTAAPAASEPAPPGVDAAVDAFLSHQPLPPGFGEHHVAAYRALFRAGRDAEPAPEPPLLLTAAADPAGVRTSADSAYLLDRQS